MQHMHVESCLNHNYQQEDISQNHIHSYQKRLVEDKELMEIFERTYGPIRRDKNSSFKPVRKNNSINNNYHAKPIPTGPEYLLVDGYNIIFAWDELNEIAKDNLDLARNQLINILCNYQ